MVFDLFDSIFKKYGELREVKKTKQWISRLAGYSFDVGLVASWFVEENRWNKATREIEEKLGIAHLDRSR